MDDNQNFEESDDGESEGFLEPPENEMPTETPEDETLEDETLADVGDEPEESHARLYLPSERKLTERKEQLEEEYERKLPWKGGRSAKHLRRAPRHPPAPPSPPSHGPHPRLVMTARNEENAKERGLRRVGKRGKRGKRGKKGKIQRKLVPFEI